MANTSHAVRSQRHEPKDSLDFFPTPPWATRALTEWFCTKRIDTQFQSVWEPACGMGDMVHALRESFKVVFRTDIKDYTPDTITYDFVSDKKQIQELDRLKPDWIITNPPFRLGKEFFEKAYQRAKTGVALLVRVTFLEGGKRYDEIFSKTPPSYILQFSGRVPMHKDKLEKSNTTATSYVWLVWMKDRLGYPAIFEWLPPDTRNRLEKDSDYGRW